MALSACQAIFSQLNGEHVLLFHVVNGLQKYCSNLSTFVQNIGIQDRGLKADYNAVIRRLIVFSYGLAATLRACRISR